MNETQSLPASTSDRPEPPIPDACDLREHAEVPLDVSWFQQVFLPLHTLSGTVPSAVRLWLAAWQQVPAGSLPNDDRLLCALSGGHRLSRFQKDKEALLQGWVLCSDDRWYHPVLAEQVLRVVSARGRRARSARVAAQARWSVAPTKSPRASDQTESRVDASEMLPKPERKRRKSGGGALRDDLLALDLPESVSLDVWTRFVDFRFDTKKPLTLQGGKLALHKLDELRKAGNDPEAVVNQSILSGWMGLFAVQKGKSAGRGVPPRRERSPADSESHSGGAVTLL